MKAFKVLEIKDFMSKMFNGNVFDNFLIKEVRVKTFYETTIDGTRQMEFYDDDEKENLQSGYISWNEVKPLVLNIIKGNKLPVAMSFILVLSDENMNKMNEKAGIKLYESENAKCILNIRYEGGECKIYTATARSGFSLDKSFENEWDRTMGVFLKHYQIVVEEI